MPLKQIKDFWEYMGSKVIVRGKGEESFEDWINQDYTIDYLIKKNFLKESSVNEKDFSLIRVQKGKKEEHDKRLIYIDKVLRNGFDFDGDVRVKYGNIHTVKGMTFDNVIVDNTLTRREDYFTQLRLKYVAYSRGRIDCWTIGSQDRYILGGR
jgi:diadenosine tetraphosphatase ApaH/serine/threonine PP2A family protein phosphatase